MYRYVLMLLLINTYYRTSGNTLPLNTLSNSLTELALRCENSFLANQIKSKINNCSVIVPPNKNQFSCLIFYDINSRLCDAVSASKLTLNEDFTNKINEVQNVNKLCNITKDWKVMNVSEYPQYKITVEKVFRNPFMCAKVCGVDDFLSDDTNFFCKYYKWGLEMLHSSMTVTTTQVLDTKDALPVVVDAIAKKPETPVIASNVNPSDTQSSNIRNINEQTKEQESNIDKTTSTKIEETIKNEAVKANINNLESSSNGQESGSNNPENVEKVQNKVDIKVHKPVDQFILSSGNVARNNDALGKDEDMPLKKEDIDKDQPLSNPPSEPKETVIENPKTKQQNADPDEYQGNDLDSEEGKEGLTDIQGGDDSDDPILGDLEIKADTEQNKNNVKRIEAPMSSFNGEISQKEFFPNTLQDGFTEDDDHFFPFFLTAVILVVLLYVLYHNKSKVSKVFLGLIVEGRQTGRRRNSRGHSYRRLDTLEQAMSANTSAPPSKIIY